MSKLHAFSWLLFAATAFIAALLFPVTIFYFDFSYYLGFDQSKIINQISSSVLLKILFFIIIGSTIYHGFYRAKAVMREIATKHEDLIEISFLAIAIILVILALFVIILI